MANCSIAEAVSFPEGFIGTTGGNFIWDYKGGDVILPSTVTKLIGNGNFGYIRQNTRVIIRATTPPELSGTSYINASGNYKVNFYVPDAAFADYQSAATWSTYYGYGRVHKMSELTE